MNCFIERVYIQHNITIKLINGKTGLVDNKAIESCKETYKQKLESMIIKIF